MSLGSGVEAAERVAVQVQDYVPSSQCGHPSTSRLCAKNASCPAGYGGRQHAQCRLLDWAVDTYLPR